MVWSFDKIKIIYKAQINMLTRRLGKIANMLQAQHRTFGGAVVRSNKNEQPMAVISD
jgi:hypothetical protein